MTWVEAVFSRRLNQILSQWRHIGDVDFPYEKMGVSWSLGGRHVGDVIRNRSSVDFNVRKKKEEVGVGRWS